MRKESDQGAPGRESNVLYLPSSLTLLKSPWTHTLERLLSSADNSLMLVSPFVRCNAANNLLSTLTERGVSKQIRVHFLTNLRAESALAGALELEAFIEMGKVLPLLELTHVPSLHAKVYVADTRMAVITSGNLTSPGIDSNVEYGVAFTEAAIVAEIRQDFEDYAGLGTKVSTAEVAALLDEISELKRLFKRAENSIRSKARRMFKEKLQSTRLQILRQSVKGKATHAIFADTIVFLLANGPLRTEDLHPMIRTLQPDLCDDSIDRVIDGVHFGKRWKHYVRNAQQSLKRQGRINFDGDKWHLNSRHEHPA